MDCPVCSTPMKEDPQIGHCCENLKCPVLDDADLWYQDSRGNWKVQKWIKTEIQPGHWKLTLSPKDMT